MKKDEEQGAIIAAILYFVFCGLMWAATNQVYPDLVKQLISTLGSGNLIEKVIDPVSVLFFAGTAVFIHQLKHNKKLKIKSVNFNFKEANEFETLSLTILFGFAAIIFATPIILLNKLLPPAIVAIGQAQFIDTIRIILLLTLVYYIIIAILRIVLDSWTLASITIPSLIGALVMFYRTIHPLPGLGNQPDGALTFAIFLLIAVLLSGLVESERINQIRKGTINLIKEKLNDGSEFLKASFRKIREKEAIPKNKKKKTP